MGDIVDRADKWVRLELAERIQGIRSSAAEYGRVAAGGPVACCDCGDDIPEARREAVPGCCRCVDCQAMREGGK